MRREDSLGRGYTANLRLAQQAAGSNANVWGPIANSAFLMLEQAVTQETSVSVASGNVTLTTSNNAQDQSRSSMLIFTGAPVGTNTVTIPNVQKQYFVWNNASQPVTVTAGAGTTVTVPVGAHVTLYSDGSTNVAAQTVFQTTMGGTLAIGNGVSLSVTANSNINQDVRTTASPTFAGVSATSVSGTNLSSSAQTNAVTGAFSGKYSNGSATSGTFYTAISAATLNAIGVGAVVGSCASGFNVAGVSWIINVADNTAQTLTALQAGTDISIQMSGGALQAAQTTGAPNTITCGWLIVPGI